MDVLKAQLARIQQQLSGLSASQKMLTVSLVAIMVLTTAYWARYASTAEMVPVLEQSLSAEDMPRIRAKLAAVGIDSEIAGDRILVPVEKKYFAMGQLATDQLLPRDTSNSFDEMIKNVNPFSPQAQTDQIFKKYLTNELEKVICSIPGVATARVFLDEKSVRRVGETIKPVASVTVRMREGENGKKLVQGIADLVAGSNAELTRSRINITINGTPYPVADRDASGLGSASELGELELAAQTRYEETIQKNLAYFPGGVIASVRVRVDNISTHTQENRTDSALQKEKTTETEGSESTTPNSGGGEPGAGANLGLSVAPAAPTNSTTSTQKDKTTFEILPSTTLESRDKGAGQTIPVSASVHVPRSYYANRLKANGAPSTDAAAIDAYIEKQLVSVRDSVKKCLSLKDEDIFVDAYDDAPPTMLAAVSATDGALASVSGGSGGSIASHAREIAIGSLAVLSLFMVTMMVRKSSPVPATIPVMEDNGPPMLSAGEALAGEVAGGEQTLDGMELDEDAVRAQQMVEQVSTMVQENPDAAANLVKRWLNRS